MTSLNLKTVKVIQFPSKKRNFLGQHIKGIIADAAKEHEATEQSQQL